MWTKKKIKKKVIKADLAGESQNPDELSPAELAVANAPDTAYGDVGMTSKFGDFNPEQIKLWLAGVKAGKVPEDLEKILSKFPMPGITRRERLDALENVLTLMLL